PSSRASAKLANANPRCASTSRRTLYTAQPPGLARHLFKGLARDHLDPGPHGRVSRAAVLVTRHAALSSALQRRDEGRDVTRHEHGIDVGAENLEAVHDIAAGRAEGHGHAIRHHQTVRMESVLLRQ